MTFLNGEENQANNERLILELEQLRRRVKELEHAEKRFKLSDLKAKQKFKNLRERERKYKTFFTRMIDGYAFHKIICDESGKPVDYRFLEINPAFEKLTGLSRDILGKTIREVIPDIEVFWIETYGAVALTGKPVKFENYSTSLKKWFEIVAYRPAKDHFACIFADITDRKEAIEKLRRLRSLNSNIVNSMPSILIGVDPEGRVIEWNTEAEKETGILSEKASGKMLVDIVPHMENEMRKVRLSMLSKKPQKEEKISYKKDGEIRFRNLTIYPLVANGVDGAVIRIDDITERVRIEDMMIQSEKMMSVGGLAAGMAHEINNPLAGILQNAQVICNRFKIDLPKNRQLALESGTTIEAIENYMKHRSIFSMLEAILESGRRAAKIVENMLTFSRKSESKSAPHDIRKLLDQTVELASSDYDLKKKYDFRRIEIRREYDKDIPDIQCEGTKLQQVFLNLLKNGAQALSERLALESKEGKQGDNPQFVLRVAHEKETNQVRIEVEDNGIGMEKTISRRVFEPFFTTKEMGVGTGLGLSVSYFIITRNHGGKMTVESIPKKGTIFIIWLPLPLKGGAA